ncbi:MULTISPECIES: sulfatase [Maribacter]|uniref:Sulfatase-like hydrolase/transferase n=1 Tax=Maribacter flavus TaxID=1658664 RepID=A0ABU7IGC3_9FLAO|nr:MULTISPECIES: sulfatase-like hydrolase/transferase [Maribacter]MDC6405189.1 sulfatase-like hydrolase/transferase [Maribacter sp. PR66]MEE1972002.1 sulfatase-like hydrolase/transferase [Maribacter flavus]
MFNRVYFKYLCILIASVFGCNISGQDSLGIVEKPNILLILTDDQGYHDVSYYGTKDIRTPNIDQITASGMRFDNFYANAPVCSPTRAALLTGRYQDYVGVPGVIRTNPDNNWGYLDPKATLLPEELKMVGYSTALIGKWHLGLDSPNTPIERGFDFFHGWLGDMMDDYWDHRRHDINYMRLNAMVIDPKGHATDLFTDWSVDYIKSQADDNRPFFLYLAYNAPHFPVQPPEDWLEKVKKREKGIEETRANLVAFIEHMDNGIGKVIQALKESGQYDNTLIVFSSDNGGHLPSKANNGPLRDGKQSMYEGGLKVPTAISWPGKIRQGSVSEEVQISMDLYPTLLEIAGVKPKNKIEGQSFYSQLVKSEPSLEPDRSFYFTRREGGTKYGGQAIYALRKGDWKLLQNSPNQGYELYNLKEDPLEQMNRIDSDIEKYQELNFLLMKHIQKGGEVPWQKSSY